MAKFKITDVKITKLGNWRIDRHIDELKYIWGSQVPFFIIYRSGNEPKPKYLYAVQLEGEPFLKDAAGSELAVVWASDEEPGHGFDVPITDQIFDDWSKDFWI